MLEGRCAGNLQDSEGEDGGYYGFCAGVHLDSPEEWAREEGEEEIGQDAYAWEVKQSVMNDCLIDSSSSYWS